MLPDYLHSVEADHFAFIRVPKILLQNETFQGISAEAKLLYSLLFDRTELSNKNGWKMTRIAFISSLRWQRYRRT